MRADRKARAWRSGSFPFWLGSSLSFVGDGLRFTAAPLLALHLGASPLAVSGLIAVSTAPWLLFSVVSGTIVDRTVRRLLLVRVDAVRALIGGLLVVLLLTHRATLAVLYAVAFLMGAGETLFVTGSHALVPELVESDDELSDLNGALARSRGVGQELLGPAAGGVLFSLFASLPFLLDALSFGASSFLLSVTRPRRGYAPPGGPRKALLTEAREGLRWLRSQPLLLVMAGTAGLINLVNMAGVAIAAPFIIRVLKAPGYEFGLVTTASALAGIATSYGLKRLKGRRREGVAVGWAVPLLALSYIVVGVSPGIGFVFAGYALGGCGSMIWNVSSATLRQRVTPPELLGRAESVYRLVAWGVLPVGSLVGGLVGRSLGLRAPFLLGGSLLVALSFLVVPVLSGTKGTAGEGLA